MGCQSSFYWLRCTTFLAFAGLACFIPFVTVHLRSLGLSLSEIGAIHFVTSTTSLLGIVIAGVPVTVPGQRFVFGLTLLIAAFMGGALLLTPGVRIIEHSTGLSEMICGPYGSALVRQRCGSTCEAYSDSVNFTLTDCTFKASEQHAELGLHYVTHTPLTSTPSVFTESKQDADQPSRGDLPLSPSSSTTTSTVVSASEDQEEEDQEPSPEVYDYESTGDFRGNARRRRRIRRQEQQLRGQQENEEYEGEDEGPVNGNALPHVCLEPEKKSEGKPDSQHNSKGYCYVFTTEMPGLTLRTPLQQYVQKGDVCYYPLTALEAGKKQFGNMACRVPSPDKTVQCKVQEAQVKFINETSQVCHVVEGNLHLTFWLYLILRTIAEVALVAALLLLGVLTATATRSWHWKRRQRSWNSLNRHEDFPTQEITTIQTIQQKAVVENQDDLLEMEEVQANQGKKRSCGPSQNPPFWWISAVLGLALIGPLAGFVIDVAGFQACLLMGGCLFGLAVFFLAIGPAILLPDPTNCSDELPDLNTQRFQEVADNMLITIPAPYLIHCNRIGKLLRDKSICLLLAAMLLFGLLWGELHTCFYWYASDIISVKRTLGVYLSVAALTSLIIFPTLPWLISRCGYPCIFMFGLLIYAARFLGYVLLEWDFVIAGLEALEAFTGTWMWLTGMHGVQSATKPDNGTTAWALAVICHFCIGRGMGSLISALAATHFGVRAVFVCTAIICAVIAGLWLCILYCCIKPRKRSRLRPKIYCVPASPVRNNNALPANGASYTPLKTSNSRDSAALN